MTKVPDTNPAPELPADPQRIFGNSPIKRPLTGRHPARSDASEQENLAQASATTPLTSD